jgi:hypothetical protein
MTWDLGLRKGRWWSSRWMGRREVSLAICNVCLHSVVGLCLVLPNLYL